jgi:hypothetical protein
MRTRLFVLSTATISAASLVLAIGTAPSQAQTPAAVKPAVTASHPGKPDYVQYPSYCLSNTPHHDVRCLGAQVKKKKKGPRDTEGTISLVISVIDTVIALWQIFGPRGPGKHKKGKKPPESELKAEGDAAQGVPSGPVRGRCLADKGGKAYFGNCDTLAARWYMVPDGDSFAMESAWALKWYDAPYYLTLSAPYNGYHPYIALAGSAGWQVWTWA